MDVRDMKHSEAVPILVGLRNEFARKAEEIWSRGLDYGYESATSEHDKTATALQKAIDVLSELED